MTSFDWGAFGAIIAVPMAGWSAWLTYRATRENTHVAEGDLTLRGLAQLNTSCLARCAALEARESALLKRIEDLEAQIGRLKNG